MDIKIKSIIYNIIFNNGLEVEIKETNGLLDYIKPLNGSIGTIFYLNLHE